MTRIEIPVESWAELPKDADGKVGAQCYVKCVHCADDWASMNIAGRSHDDNPSIETGSYVCINCLASGKWAAQEKAVGVDGIDVPTALLLSDNLGLVRATEDGERLRDILREIRQGASQQRMGMN